MGITGEPIATVDSLNHTTNIQISSIVQPEAATFKDLAKFHSKDYITCLQKADDCDEDDVEESLEEFGIGMYEII